MDDDRLEAIQNVIDRVTSYQDAAPDGTVEKELRSGLEEAGLELDDEQVGALVDAIEQNRGEVVAGDVLS